MSKAVDFMVDWFLPILIMVYLGVFSIGWLIVLLVHTYSQYINNGKENRK